MNRLATLARRLYALTPWARAARRLALSDRMRDEARQDACECAVAAARALPPVVHHAPPDAPRLPQRAGRRWPFVAERKG